MGEKSGSSIDTNQLELTEETCRVIADALEFVDDRKSVTAEERQLIKETWKEFVNEWANTK